MTIANALNINFVVNDLIYANSATTLASLATANSAMLVTNSTGVPALSATMTNGQVIIGSTGATPTASTLSAGSGVTITNAAGSITISSTGGGFSTVDQTTTPVTMVASTQYIADNAGLVTLTLPAVAAIGDTFRIIGKGAGGWLMGQAAGQTSHVGNQPTTLGVTGSVASTNQWDVITIICVTANTTFSVQVNQGNVTIAEGIINDYAKRPEYSACFSYRFYSNKSIALYFCR